MIGPKRQRGVGFFGLMLLAVLVGLPALLGLRVLPMYSEYFAIRSVVNDVAEDLVADPRFSSFTASDVWKPIYNQLVIDGIDTKFRRGEELEIDKDSGGFIITVDYERRAPFMFNLGLVGKFDLVKEIYKFES